MRLERYAYAWRDYMSHFFFNDPAPTEIYTLSLHDALPIFPPRAPSHPADPRRGAPLRRSGTSRTTRQSSHHFHEIGRAQRLNSSHTVISYAVFCLKKKNHESPTGLFNRRRFIAALEVALKA